MRLQTRILSATLGVLLVAAAAPAAMAQGPGRGLGAQQGHRGSGGHDGMQRLFEFLGLTEEQRQAWTDAHQSHFEALRPTFEEMRDLREQLRAELEGGAPDAATVGGLVIASHELEVGLKASHADLEAAINEILTDEQETKLAAWKAANPGPQHGFGPGGPGPGGPHRGGPQHGGPGSGAGG